MKPVPMLIAVISAFAVSGASADSLKIQPFIYFSTASGFGDADISVYAGNAKWRGVTDSTGATTHSGTFGDGTVLDYHFVGNTRGPSGAFKKHASGVGTYISPMMLEVYGATGGANTGLDIWTDTNPDRSGSFDTTPDSDSFTGDHVAGGSHIRGTVDVSKLSSARIYFIYGSFNNQATISLTDGAGNPLGELSIPANTLDKDRLVIQEVTIDNDDGSYGIINFDYTAQKSAGRGRFSGVIIDGK